MVYTHISDTYTPFSTNMVNVGTRDSTYVLDGLLHHESDLRIEEHYTDTVGFTDHVSALKHMLGFRFAPRIRDLGDTKLYIPGAIQEYTGWKTMIGGTLNIKPIRAHWDDILRLTSSIKYGTVTAHSCCANSAATRTRTAWRSHCASWAASSGHGLFATGYRASICVDTCMPD